MCGRRDSNLTQKKQFFSALLSKLGVSGGAKCKPFCEGIDKDRRFWRGYPLMEIIN